jgi:uncharacterized protein (TIGR02246 family)
MTSSRRLNHAAVIMLTQASLMALSLGLASATVQASETGPTLEQQIHILEADRQIRNLMSRYGQYLDAKNFEAYAGLFAKEGEWSGNLSGYATIKGPDNIRAAMEKAFAERVYDPAHITNLHLVTNIEINVEGQRATAFSRYTVFSRNEADQPYARVSGRYDDVFILENGQWKFLSRATRREIPSAD